MLSGPSYQSSLNVHAPPAPQCMAVESRGCLVPAGDFSATVHGAFDSACNLQVDDGLLTLVAPGVGRGATTMRLTRSGPLRRMFIVGERLVCRGGVLRASRVWIDLRDSGLWSAPTLPAAMPEARIRANLGDAAARLARHRHAGIDVLDREASQTIAALQRACTALDGVQARQLATRLVGWGEGLTPSGDDFLTGLLAALDTRPSPERMAFRDALAAAIRAGLSRTTPVAAQLLVLAAAGHFGEPLCLLRNVLISECDPLRAPAALDAALNVGETSGADTVSGLLAGLESCWNAAAALH